MNTVNYSSRRDRWFTSMFFIVCGLVMTFFGVVFLSVVLKGLYAALAFHWTGAMASLLMVTLRTLSLSLLIAVPVSGFLTFVVHAHERSTLSRWSLVTIQESLRVPPVVTGIVLLFALRSFDNQVALYGILIGLLIPRLVYGWVGILRRQSDLHRQAGLAMGFSESQVFFKVYLPVHWPQMLECLLKVSTLLLGAVAPFAYLTSFSFLTQKAQPFFSLEVLQELVRGHDQDPQVWVYLTGLIFFTVIFAAFDGSDIMGLRDFQQNRKVPHV